MLHLLAAAILLLTMGCQTKRIEDKVSPQMPENGAAKTSFGASVPAGAAKSIAEVVANVETLATQSVLVEGVVQKVCQNKGCWMEIADAAGSNGPSCRVIFKDYGFFVPKDSQGVRARLYATVQVATVSPQRVRHLEQEGARFSQRRQDGSATEVKLVASGVELNGAP